MNVRPRPEGRGDIQGKTGVMTDSYMVTTQ